MRFKLTKLFSILLLTAFFVSGLGVVFADNSWDRGSLNNTPIQLVFAAAENFSDPDDPTHISLSVSIAGSTGASQNQTFLQCPYLKPVPRISLALQSLRTVILLT